MKKFLHLLLPLFLLISFCSRAQLQPAKEYYSNLLKKNQALLGLTGSTPDNWRISDAHFDKHNNVNYVYVQQTFKDIDIDKAITPLSFKNDKLVTGTLNSFQKNIKTTTNQFKPVIDAKTALLNAAHSLNLDIKTPITTLSSPLQKNAYLFDGLGISYNKIPVRLLWVRAHENDESLILAWQVTISSFINNALWSINVDAITGKIVNSTNLTVYEQSKTGIKKPHQILVFEDIDKIATSDNFQDIKSINSSKYNVIAYPNESPLTAVPSLQTNPWTQNHDQDANTLKWNNNDTTDFKILRGNNVYVQQDLDSTNNTAGYSTSSSTNPPDLTFNKAINLNGDPIEDPDFAETNLFYWNNLMHDLSYQYGFDEAAGNFQNNNLGRGGKANDFLYADAQDGGGKGTHINNANFSTPVDGSNPRQQMYLFSPSFLKTFVANSPDKFKGGKPSLEGNVSNQNKLALGTKTAPIVIYKDALHPDSSNACGAPANASELSGKIAYIDRGSCNFTVKYHNAQQAGAIAIIVGNVSPTDPRYIGNSPGNALVTMTADPLDNTITIPGVFIQYDTAKKIKALGSGAITATLQATPNIDGSLDNTIHTHEYTHGISNRLVGGPQNVACLNNMEQMGEGWSDWYALMITQNWTNSSITGDHIRVIGNYAIGLDSDGAGIRVYPYSTNFNYNPWTYDSLKALGGTILDPPDEHTIGEIWATMLWDMTWGLISKYGISQNIFDATGAGGNVIALHLVTQGMKLTNCDPGFVDARNGILDADTLLFGGKYSFDIWKAFAKRGLGYSAKQGTSSNTIDGTPAYDVPEALPVTFSSFTTEKQGNTALLKWTTAQESNTNNFIVERSADGKPFVSIGEVKAAGNSSVKKYYQFTDPSPLTGVNLYHIKEVDNDGKVNVSDIRSLNFADISPSVIISPNPATNIVAIRIPGNNQNLTIRLLSNTGQLISTHAMSNELYSVDVSKLAAGVYNIVINGSDYSKKYKLVIQ